MAVKIQFRRDTAINWQNANPVLSQGELGLDITNNRFKLGDGSTAWNDLDYTIDLAYDFQPDGTYANLRAQGTTAADVGLGNVDNESKATMFTNPTFTGDVSGITRDHVGLGNVNNEAQIPLTQKGVAGGVATLDGSGLVPSDQLPSYVDDILEGYYNAAGDSLFYEDAGFTTPLYEAPNEGEQGKIYVDLASNASYRWTGSTYVEISSPLDFASQAEAEAGTNDAKSMSPLRTKQAIAELETKTSISIDSDIITYTNESGTNTEINLSDYKDVKKSDTLPENLQVGDLWFDTTNKVLYLNKGTDTTPITLNNPDIDASDFIEMQMGRAVVVNENFVFVGTYGNGSNEKVFVYDSSNGDFLYSIDNPGSSFERFSENLALTDNFLVVSAKLRSNGGAILVYSYNSSSATLERTIANPGSGNDNFGDSLAAHGNLVITGATLDDTTGSNAGIVYVHDLTNGNLIQTLNNPNSFGTEAGDNFGYKVAINDTYAIVSSIYEDATDNLASGVVYVYDISNWNLIQTIANPNPDGSTETQYEFKGDRFGSVLALSGNYLAVTALLYNQNPEVYVYDVSNGNLLRTLVYVDSNDQYPNDNFGYSLAVDGNNLMVGARVAQTATEFSVGEAFMYDITTGELLYTFKNPTAAGYYDEFGTAVAIKGSKIVITAPLDDYSDGKDGRAFLYSFADVLIQTDNSTSTEFSAGVIETNNDNNLKFWQGTQAEYDAVIPTVSTVLGDQLLYSSMYGGGTSGYFIENYTWKYIVDNARISIDGVVAWQNGAEQNGFGSFYYEDPNGENSNLQLSNASIGYISIAPSYQDYVNDTYVSNQNANSDTPYQVKTELLFKDPNTIFFIEE